MSWCSGTQWGPKDVWSEVTWSSFSYFCPSGQRSQQCHSLGFHSGQSEITAIPGLWLYTLPQFRFLKLILFHAWPQAWTNLWVSNHHLMENLSSFINAIQGNRISLLRNFFLMVAVGKNFFLNNVKVRQWINTSYDFLRDSIDRSMK